MKNPWELYFKAEEEREEWLSRATVVAKTNLDEFIQEFEDVTFTEEELGAIPIY